MPNAPSQPDTEAQSALEEILNCQSLERATAAFTAADRLKEEARLYIADRLEEGLCDTTGEQLLQEMEDTFVAMEMLEHETDPASIAATTALDCFRIPALAAVFIIRNKGAAAAPLIQCYVEELANFSDAELNTIPAQRQLYRNALEKLSRWPQIQAQRLAEQAASKAAQEQKQSQAASEIAETQLTKLKKLRPKTSVLKRNGL